MTLDEVKAEFARLSRDDKRLFMEDVGLDLLQDLVTNPGFTYAVLSHCSEMVADIPNAVLKATGTADRRAEGRN